jgi:hypothetical protein
VEPEDEMAAAPPQAILAEETVVPTVNASHRITGNNAEADRVAVLAQLASFKQ